MAKPFVPGAERAAAQSFQIESTARPTQNPESLPGIDEFLEREAPVATQTAFVDESYESEFDEPDELPPVEHFLDPLPPVSHFSAEDFPAGGGAAEGEGYPQMASEPAGTESDWLETDWQSFDWRAAAALGETAATEASNAWSTTDWDASSPRAKPSRQTAAHAFAKALDEIAQRIRDGELTVPTPGTASDPATIAATLAALLGIRR